MVDFSGILQADAYAGFHHLYDTGRIAEAACWAHARRKFHDIYLVYPSPTATEPIKSITALYAIEKTRDSPPELRKAARLARAAPLLAEVRHRDGHPLCQRWAPGDRQQRR